MELLEEILLGDVVENESEVMRIRRRIGGLEVLIQQFMFHHIRNDLVVVGIKDIVKMELTTFMHIDIVIKITNLEAKDVTERIKLDSDFLEKE